MTVSDTTAQFKLIYSLVSFEKEAIYDFYHAAA